MQNLKYPNMKYLINVLTVKDFGYYTFTDPDDGSTVKKLVIKKNGQEIPFVSGSTTLKNEVSKPGAYKSVLVQLNAPAPCRPCRYEYEISIHSKWQQPGNMNDDYYSSVKLFGGVLESIQTPSAGYMADSDKLIMEDNIITQIESDQGGVNTVRSPNVVHAKRLYIMTVPLAGTNVISYTIAGVPLTVAMSSGATAITMVNDINADATMGAKLVAFAISATQIAVTSVNPGLIFYIDDGGGGTTMTGITRYIWIYAKYYDPKFYVDFSQFGWATVTPFNLLILDNTSAAAGNTVLYVGSTASGNIANNATSTTYAASIVSSALGTGGTAPNYLYASAKATTGNVYVYVYSGANEVVVRSLGTAGVTANVAYSGKGAWATLTSTDVFRAFMNQRGLDRLSFTTFMDQVLPDLKWNKITINYRPTNPALDGASHRDVYDEYVEIYIAQGYGGTSLWDATYWMDESTADHSGFTVDSSINALLAAWSGFTASTSNGATTFLTII